MTPGRILAVLGVAGLIAAVSASAQDRGASLYEAARQSYLALADDGPGGRSPEAWRRTAAAFHRIREADPASGRASDGLYMAGLCLERAHALSANRGDRARAVQAYEGLAREYPRSNLADDALLRAGRILELEGDLDRAGTLYRRVGREHPDGDMAELARRRLANLGKGTRVVGVRAWSGADYTRIVVDLSRTGAFEAGNLRADPATGAPARLYLDFARGELGHGCPRSQPVADGLVKQVRTGQYDRNTARVVLDLAAAATVRVFPLEGPARVVVDVFRARGGEDTVADLIAEGPEGRPTRRPLRIMVDPGHGGKDPGAVGPGGILEKDVTLALGRDLARTLRALLPCEVRLTRDDDRYLSLEERTAAANAFGADLFVSVHANASRSRRAEGVETYYLDRASDRSARRLAARENASGEAAVAEIEHILADVVLTTKIRDSRRLAQTLQKSLVVGLSRDYGPVRDLGVKRGPFYVLTGAVMPAVLVETSFITHPVEARRLANEQFRQDAARAMAQGVEEFIRGG